MNKTKLSNPASGMALVPMTSLHKQAIRKTAVLLINSLNPIVSVYLYSLEIFNDHNYEDINDQVTRTNKVGKIIEILLKKQDEAFHAFCRVLRETDQEFLALELIRNLSDVDPLRSTVQVENVPHGIQLRILTRNRMGELCFCPEESLRVKMEDNEGRQIDVKIVYNEKENGNNIVHQKTVKEGQYRITTTFEGHDIDERIVNIISELKPVKTFGSGGEGRGQFSCPCGITVNEQQCVLIADTGNHRVQVFNSSGEYQRELGGKGSKKGQMKRPRGVAVDKYNNNIIVSDTGNNRVQVFSVDGVFIRSIGEGRVERPWGVCVCNQGNVVVCSQGDKGGVKMFSRDGVFIREFGNQYTAPSYITCTNGTYFVSYSDEHCIRVFADDNGQFVRQFGSRGRGNGQFNKPRGLTVYGHSYLLVCDMENHRVQVLTQEGECVSTFGSAGSNLGEMFCPVDLTVLPDGRTVMVIEYNHRVHVWR